MQSQSVSPAMSFFADSESESAAAQGRGRDGSAAFQCNRQWLLLNQPDLKLERSGDSEQRKWG